MSSTSNAIQSDPALHVARQALYRYTALAFLDPRAGSWSRLIDRQSQECVQAAAELLRSEPSLVPPAMALGELPLERLDPADMFALLPTSPERLNAEFEKTFSLLVSGTCPPHETEYINSKFTFQRSHELADIAGFYRAFGLKTSAEHPERHDHIVLELEFMAFLIGLERQAESEGQPSGHRAEVCRDAQSKFLKEHLAWWVPTFAKLLAHEQPDGFFASVAALLAALIPAERALLGVDAPSHSVGPSTVERPEECQSCLLHSM